MNSLFIAASGLKADASAIANLTNDLANVDSTGFLALLPQNIGDPAGVVERVGGPMGNAPISTVIPIGVGATSVISQSPSSLKTTGIATDLAQTGAGYFVVQTANGVAYTRDGRFHVTPQGYLANASGALLLTAAGQLVKVNNANFSVTPQGVLTQTGSAPQQIGLANLAGTMTSQGQGILTGARAPYQGTVQQGAVNSSNVALDTTLSSLITWQSAYQATAQVVTEEQTRLSTASALGSLQSNVP